MLSDLVCLSPNPEQEPGAINHWAFSRTWIGGFGFGRRGANRFVSAGVSLGRGCGRSPLVLRQEFHPGTYKDSTSRCCSMGSLCFLRMTAFLCTVCPKP